MPTASQRGLLASLLTTGDVRPLPDADRQGVLRGQVVLFSPDFPLEAGRRAALARMIARAGGEVVPEETGLAGMQACTVFIGRYREGEGYLKVRIDAISSCAGLFPAR